MNDRPRNTRLHTVRGGATADPDPERLREPLSPVEAKFAQELFERHQFALFGFLTGLLKSREEARELLQETYLRLLRQPSFEHVRENARAYLFQTAANLARDYFRRRASHGIQAERETFCASGLDTPHWESWPDLAFEGEQTRRLIIQALEDLKLPVRSALLLHRFRNLTHGQIAVRLGVSERTVERYIRDGLCVIAERLKAGL
jgi:RNA polymerase sigma factor (sigma-70 family)